MTGHSDCSPHVAAIFFQHRAFPGYPLLIRSNDDFDIGRKDIQHAFGLEELTVSSHHLHFHCVVFEDCDDEEGQQVAPLVYVHVLSSNPVMLTRLDSNNPSDTCTLRRDSGDILLNDGDVLQLTPDISIAFKVHVGPAQAAGSLDPIRRAEVKRFLKQYAVVDRLLGSGGNASVYVAVKQSTKRQFACKVVPVPLHKRQDVLHADEQAAARAKAAELRMCKERDNLAREYEVLKNLSHPNIISLEKVFCTTRSIYIFQELVTGGDLLSYVDRKTSLSEPEAAVVVRQILKAVEYLHSNQIVHRDIKPENVLMTSWRPGARVVLTDFGQSRTLEDAKSAVRRSGTFRMQSLVGTHGYTAPEVFKQMKRQSAEGYSKAIDVWSVGCVAGTLLTGEPMPFDDDDDEDAADSQAVASAKQWDLSFMDTVPSWRAVGRKAKSFIRGCLNVEESQRLTAKQALLHDWFTNKHYTAELEAAYQRAVHDWNPRSTDGALIEFINTSDIQATETKPQHIQRYVEETQSRHFSSQADHALPMSCFNMKPFHLAPPKKETTPIPSVGAELDLELSYSPSYPDVQGQLYASPFRVPNTPPRVLQRTNPLNTEASIKDLAPPETQLTLNKTLTQSYTHEWQNSVTQSQSMLDELSPPKVVLADLAAYPMEPSCAPKSNASFAQMDESYADMTQYTGDLDAPYLPRQRSKVFR